MTDFNTIQKQYVDMFNEYAAEALKACKFEGRFSSGLDRMLEAMSYSLENGGKRVRPVLTMEFCRLCGGNPKDALPFALGVEMIHTYSLIHDDLPCMDNDDMRRGKPSNHIKFGYADALLAGDGLLTMAFEIISGSDLPDDRKVKAIYALSVAAGSSGMIAGQVMDLQNEGKKVSIDTVRKTDELKTGEMIKVASRLGCIAAGASNEMTDAALKFSEGIGLVFQIVDDILDVTGNDTELGKPTGSDKDNEKSTYVSLLGLEQARLLKDKVTAESVSALNIFGGDAEFLKEFAIRLAGRKN